MSDEKASATAQCVTSLALPCKGAKAELLACGQPVQQQNTCQLAVLCFCDRRDFDPHDQIKACMLHDATLYTPHDQCRHAAEDVPMTAYSKRFGALPCLCMKRHVAIIKIMPAMQPSR